MRFMAYNLMDGGLGPGGDRLTSLARVVRSEAPDILAVSEACGFHAAGGPGPSSERLYTFERLTGLRGFILPTESSYFVGVFVRPPLPVARADAVRGTFHHGALAVTVDTGRNRPLVVVATHLHPFSSTMRVAEAECLSWFAGHVEPSADLVLMGDLNSVSPLDRSQVPPPAGGWPLRLLTPDGRLDAAPGALLARAGLTDAFRHANPDLPGPTDPTPVHASPEQARLRIDFILLGPSLVPRLRGSRVVTDPPADSASDHYPVVADLE
ncbi:MAG: endonuclease/exonuclease/phosphatase family protein [Candidatus Wallbacteria bacterium]|nr:endonuclease/exonuclease/phosphatase family protein [Candidatus Wallbacteria bacterium]